ncbi:hypothetical protein LQ318_03375 [Aliifodinibius salicampi]|uniref:EamA-like transporter family protein n=1 Tax=Fodinibius salicampi TaxID=1920655 RepID=A0ABT3PVR3_9BACT|nr:hypothetical protein [Fodinibius salicampi]MCW9711937.1 hypothetical protein [Fodinibius salicampi]
MFYLYLLLSSVCSLLIAHLLKLTEVKKLRTLNTLMVNYLVAFIVAFGVGFTEQQSAEWVVRPSVPVLLFCLVIGAFFIGNFIAYSKSVHANGMGISVAAMRLSLLVPVLLSVIIYSEVMSGPKILGIVLVVGALLLLISRGRNIRIGNLDASWLLLIIFLLTGFADASLKVYNEEFSLAFSESIFMAWIFLSAFIIGLVLAIFRKGSLATWEEVKMGMLIGIPNLYSAIFLIYALDGISGAVAFPIVNTLNVLGGTFLGLWFWDDIVSQKQWGGIAIAIIAILLLV